MLARLRGHRARLTIVESGATIPVRVINSNGGQAVATFELNDTVYPSGQVIVEAFAAQKYLIFPAKLAEEAPANTVVLELTGKTVESTTDTDMSLLLEKLPVTVKFNYKRIKTHVIGGGAEGMAIVLDAEIPADSKVEVSIEEDGRIIETEGYITHIHKRGKGYLAIYRFVQMPRVTGMYWNRILKTV